MESGFNYSASFFINSEEAKKINLENLIIPIIFLKLMLFIFIFVIFYFINNIIHLTNFTTQIFSLILLMIFMSGINLNWIYLVKLKNKILLYATIFARVIFLLLIFTLIQNENDVWAYFVSVSLCFFIINIITIIWLRNLKLSFGSLNRMPNIFKVSFKFFINNFVTFNLNSIWGFGLIAFGMTSQLVYFNLADQFYRAINVLTGSIPPILYSTFSKKSQLDQSIKVVKLIVLLLIPAYIVAYIVVDPVFNLFFNFEYIESLPYIKLYLFASFILSITGLFGFPVLGLLRSSTVVQNIIYISGSLNIFLLIVWILFLPKNTLIIILIHLLINIFICLYQAISIFTYKKI